MLNAHALRKRRNHSSPSCFLLSAPCAATAGGHPVPNAPDLFCPEVHAPRGGARDRPRCATIARPNAVTAGSMAARTATVVQPTSCRQGSTRRPSCVEATLRREHNCNLACALHTAAHRKPRQNAARQNCVGRAACARYVQEARRPSAKGAANKHSPL